VTVPRRVVVHHMREHGTWLSGTEYGDGAWSILQGTWEWEPGTSVWRLHGSVGKPPDLPGLAYTIRRLRDIGFTVTTEIASEEITGIADD
jgi:hypothetical protein